MKTLLGLMVMGLVVAFLGYQAWVHVRHSANSFEVHTAPVMEDARQASQSYSEAQDAQNSVTVAGPLAGIMAPKTAATGDKVETIAYKPVASDHVGGSVVGTSLTVLHQKFRVAETVDLPFEVPAHAAMPHLHGTFQSFYQVGAKPSSDTQPDVEFLLLSDAQYSDYLNGHPGEPIFSADATHDQDVNASLPPTMNQPVKYHFVFRNPSRATKKVVQADFRIDF